MLMFSGSGGPGSASILNTIGIRYSGTNGPDGIYCTADDPLDGLIFIAPTLPAVTGTATAVVHNANGTDGVNLGPVTTTGAPFSCAALAQGSSAGAGLVQAFAFVHLDTVGDMAVTGQFFATGSSCAGDCNGSGEVMVNELIVMVNIALGGTQASACPHGVPGSAVVDIGLIVAAVNNALHGCG